MFTWRNYSGAKVYIPLSSRVHILILLWLYLLGVSPTLYSTQAAGLLSGTKAVNCFFVQLATHVKRSSLDSDWLLWFQAIPSITPRDPLECLEPAQNMCRLISNQIRFLVAIMSLGEVWRRPQGGQCKRCSEFVGATKDYKPLQLPHLQHHSPLSLSDIPSHSPVKMLFKCFSKWQF